jgi:hypothetical protein
MIVGDGQRLTEVNIGRRDAVELQKLRRQSVSGRSRWLALRLDWWTMVLFSLKGGLKINRRSPGCAGEAPEV